MTEEKPEEKKVEEKKAEEPKEEKKDDGSKDKTGSNDKAGSNDKTGSHDKTGSNDNAGAPVEPRKAKSAVSGKEKDNGVLSADPQTGYFTVIGGTSDHMLVNTSDKRLAVKIRCSNNQVYRVHPVTMFIDPGQCQHMLVTRLPGPPRKDKLVIQYVFCSVDDRNAKEFFDKLPKDAKPDTIRINLKMKEDKKMDLSSEPL